MMRCVVVSRSCVEFEKRPYWRVQPSQKVPCRNQRETLKGTNVTVGCDNNSGLQTWLKLFIPAVAGGVGWSNGAWALRATTTPIYSYQKMALGLGNC